MFERYTEWARRVIFFARYEASQFGSAAIHPEHLLLGLVREGKGVPNSLLAQSSVSLEQIRRAVEARSVVNEKTSTAIEIPFARPAKDALQDAATEADLLMHSEIGTEHLLLGLLAGDPRTSVAAAILSELGITLEKARLDLAALVDRDRSTTDTAASQENVTPLSTVVAIAPTASVDGGSERGSDDRWRLEGFTVAEALQRATRFPPTRIDLRTTLPDGRFDFEVHNRPALSRRVAERMLENAIENHFTLEISRESRLLDVLVLTAPEGIRSAPHPAPGGGCGSASISSVVRHEPSEEVESVVLGLSAPETTIGELCELLEGALNKPVIDETGITGCYDIELNEPTMSEPVDWDTMPGSVQFLDRLRSEYGLHLTPAKRAVTVLTVG